MSKMASHKMLQMRGLLCCPRDTCVCHVCAMSVHADATNPNGKDAVRSHTCPVVGRYLDPSRRALTSVFRASLASTLGLGGHESAYVKRTTAPPCTVTD